MKTQLAACALLTICLVQITSSATPALPKSWIKCKKSDPKFESCLKTAILDAIKKMTNKGVPSLGVFPIDPLDVVSMDIVQGNSGPVNLNLFFRDLKIHGIAKSSILAYNASQLDNYKTYTRSLTPAYRLVGDYEISGRMLLLPITGKGKCDITLEDLDVDHYMSGEPFMLNNKIHMNITDYKLTLKPRKMIIQLDNLFNGDKRLSETMNTFMNENWEAIFPELKPSLEESFGSLFQAMANRIFGKIPMDEIFLA